jgi:hypothetical protein
MPAQAKINENPVSKTIRVWGTHVIPATQEVEIGVSPSEGSTGKSHDPIDN